MSVKNFNKVYWITALQRALQAKLVFTNYANKNYQGVLKNLGDTVKIMMIGDVAVNDYVQNTNINTAEDLNDAALMLTADQAKYFNFKMDDVDATQEKSMLMNEASSKAAFALDKAVDEYYAGLYANAGYQIYATGTTPYDINSVNVEDVIYAVKEVMDKNDMPETGRFWTCPSWFELKLLQAGLVTKTSNDAAFASGKLGNVAGFEFTRTNRLSEASTDTDVRMMVGINQMSYSHAGVINEVEAYKPELRFEDAIKGLYVFGGKILRPDVTICVHGTKASEA